MYVQSLPYTYDLTKIRTEVTDILKSTDLSQRHIKQLLLTCPKNTNDYNFFGTGKNYDWNLQKHTIAQTDFSQFNPNFQGGYLEEIWKTFPYKVGRVRLMLLMPHHSYTIHRDPEPRFHIAVQTNPDCYLLYKDHPTWYHIPADSQLYKVEADAPHTAFNCSSELRVHIVFDSVDTYTHAEQ